ncbi:MAG: histidine--tRNA ligase [Firmicutes bacterium]|nr:histidine--tRNA ligase [Bacillota bacterium]
MSITRPRGTNDFLPEQTKKWQAVEALLRNMCREYGYQEIRTPMFEDTDLFARGVGDGTDIVQKEMYTFTDRSGRSLTLRPENTAAVCRAYGENKLYGLAKEVKLYYIGPMFRYERPQAGRFRQFHQFGLEYFGCADPMADGEIITFAWDFYQRLGLKDLKLLINSVGCANCRPAYRRALTEYFQPYLEQLCGTCRERLLRNPLRLLDCKNPACMEICAGAPKITDYLCGDCAEHYRQVKQLLQAVDIPFTEDPGLVRGLDYYTNTAFEIVVDSIGAQSAVCGGGRYDGLMQEINGQSCPAVGFALGMERIFTALAAQNESIEAEQAVDVWVIGAGSRAARDKAFAVTAALRRAGWVCGMDYEDKSMKAHMKAANRSGAPIAVVIGDDEAAAGGVLVKCMEDGSQTFVPEQELPAYLSRK